jgi:transposase
MLEKHKPHEPRGAPRECHTPNLKVRPIFHWLDDRIRGHVFLCMLAYYIEWHMREKLAPMLFDDHERDEAETTRLSIVEPAPTSLPRH